MEDKLAYLLGITWIFNSIQKITITPDGLKESTQSLASESIIPIIPDIFLYLANSQTTLFYLLTFSSYAVIGNLVMRKSYRKYGVLASIMANTAIYLTAYSGGMPVFNANFLMIGIALIIGFGILEES